MATTKELIEGLDNKIDNISIQLNQKLETLVTNVTDNIVEKLPALIESSLSTHRSPTKAKHKGNNRKK